MPGMSDSRPPDGETRPVPPRYWWLKRVLLTTGVLAVALVVLRLWWGWEAERRWQAARLAGLAAVPVLVKEATPQQALELALVENIQRADLNPLEEAAAFQQLVDEFGLTQEQVAERVGKSRVAVTNTLRLLRLPAEVKQALADGTVHEGHARALLALPTPEAQIAALKTVVKQALNVRQTEELVRRLKAEPPEKKPRPPKPPELLALEEDFRASLGTKVNLHRNRKGQGRVVIHFYSEEELQTIYDVIVGGG